ncbi:MAG: hypothetical protein HYV53_02710 [Parcubacteria group bacterium]|nr:hypothetical protein [Parcubacteria group bacterium]
MGVEIYKSSEEINEKFSKKLTPESQRINLKVNNPEEAALLEQAEKHKGKTLLENTLKLIRAQLQLEARRGNLTAEQADRLFDGLKNDPAESARIKEKLIWNAEHEENDRREIIVEEIMKELMEKTKRPDLN